MGKQWKKALSSDSFVLKMKEMEIVNLELY
jgi:hypothetical protein